eukprot:Colp12_sorted_trinity150504_noHs@19166
MTCILVVLYKFRCYKIISGWLMLSTILLLFLFGYVYFAEVLSRYNTPMDWITFAFVIWNFGAVGVLSVHYVAPLRIQQAYLIVVSALLALTLIKNLPDWTTWTVLGAIAAYDLFAVLCPVGPLQVLVKTAQERNEPLLPALVYSSTMVWLVAGMADTQQAHQKKSKLTATPSQLESGSEVASLQVPGNAVSNVSISGSSVGATSREDLLRQAPPQNMGSSMTAPDDDEEKHGVKLGLGDFIFYSVLVGKAATREDWTTVLACFVAILM